MNIPIPMNAIFHIKHRRKKIKTMGLLRMGLLMMGLLMMYFVYFFHQSVIVKLVTV